MTEDEAFANLLKIKSIRELLWWARHLATGGKANNQEVIFILYGCRITDRKGRLDPVTRSVILKTVIGGGKNLQLVPLRKK